MAKFGMGLELLILFSMLIVALGGVLCWHQVSGVKIGSLSFFSRPQLTFIRFLFLLSISSFLFYLFSFFPYFQPLWLVIFTVSFGCAVGGLKWFHSLQIRLRRRVIDFLVRGFLLLAAALAVLITFSIALTLIFETLRFFQYVPFIDFMMGTRWSPSIESPDGIGFFGALPLLAGTLLVTMIAMIVAIPAGLMSAIYLSQYAHEHTRSVVKPLLELLAGIPTVVYGFIALMTISPLLQSVGGFMGLPIAAESALGVGLVMGFMIIPYIASLSDDILSAVPRALLEGSLGLGATESETIKHVIVPAAFPGIMASFLLAMSRAIGETMIVVMAAGYTARLTVNPLEAVTTMTVQIVSLLTGDQEFSSPKTLAAFALGFMLLLITLSLNIIAIRIIRHYREKYE